MAVSTYREFAPEPALAEVVVCEWERTAGPTDEVLVFPDGCVDIVWRSDGELFVAGPDRGPVVHPHEPGEAYVGLRLRPGTAATVLGNAIDEVCDQQVPLSALWGQPAIELAERLNEATSQSMRRRILGGAVAPRTTDVSLDENVLAAVDALSDLAAIPDDVGLSARQLRRRFVQQVGYGPKTFERVMRFRRFLALGSGDTDRHPGGLAGLAAAAGYADQAHLTRECKRLAGRTPAELVGP